MKLSTFFIIIMLFCGQNFSYGQNKKNSKYAKPQYTKSSQMSSSVEESDKKSTTKTSTKNSAKTNNITSNKSSSNNTISTNVNQYSEIAKFSTQLEMGAHPSLKDVENVLSAYTSLGIQFHITNNLYFGPFASTVVYTQNISSVFLGNDKILEPGTFRQTAAGLTLGVRITPPKSSIQIYPEIRGGYTFVNMQDISFGLDNKQFIDYQFIGINPRLNLGIRLSDYTWIGTVGGYHLPVMYRKGEKTSFYDPTYFHGAIALRFHLPNY